MRSEKSTRLGWFTHFGPIQANAGTLKKSKELALARSESCIAELDKHYRMGVRLVAWRGMVSLVFPSIDCGGEVHWNYTPPRTLEELTEDPLNALHRVGHGLMSGGPDYVASYALMHMAQNLGTGEVPADCMPQHKADLVSLFQKLGKTPA